MLRPDFTFSRGGLALLPILSELGLEVTGDEEPDCRWWLTPEAEWSESGSKLADAGTFVHKALAPLVRGGKLELPETPALRAMYGHARAWLFANRFVSRIGSAERSPLISLRAEVVFAYDVEARTGRELADPPGHEGTRWYVVPELRAKHGVRNTEICGRLDLVSQGIDERGAFAAVDDYKFHFGPDGSIALGQLALGALAVSKALGIERVKVTGVHVWEDRNPHLEAYDLGAWELDTVAVRLHDLAYPEAANDPTPHFGAHCKAMHCQARASCPVGQGAALQVLPASSLARKPLTGPLVDNEHAAWALAAKDFFEEIAAALGVKAKAFADAHGKVLLSNGQEYSGKSHVQMKPNLDAPGAIEALKKLGLEFALKTQTSWAAIKEAGGEEGEKKARAVLEELGAVTCTEPTVYRARKPEAPAKPAKAGRRAS